MKLKLLTGAILIAFSQFSYASEQNDLSHIQAQPIEMTQNIHVQTKAFKIASEQSQMLHKMKTDDELINDGVNFNDPWEGFNRTIFGFNETVDKALIKPIAKGYKAVVPELFRMIIGNMVSNVGDVVVVVNDLLQFRPVQAFKDASRIVINSTFGFLGMADMATGMNIPKNPTNFGETLNRWGIASGPYLVVPIFGPSTVGDTVGLVVDKNIDPFMNIDHIPTRNSVVFVKTVDKRTNLLDATDIIDESAIDPYSAMRDAYYQKKEKRQKDIKNQ